MLDQGTEEPRVSSAAALAVAPASRRRYRSMFRRAYAALVALTAALWAGAAWAGGPVAARAWPAAAKAGPAAAKAWPVTPGVGLAPVGFEARGVDLRAALRGDLDVRDALNRPVRRDLVERGLRSASLAADRGAELSRLPLARAFWSLIDRVLTGLSLGRNRPRGSRAEAPVLGLSLRFNFGLTPALRLVQGRAPASRFTLRASEEARSVRRLPALSLRC